MSSRGALVAVLVAVLGVTVYWLMGRSDAPETAPDAPVAESETPSRGTAPTGSPTGRRSSTDAERPNVRVALEGRVEVQGEGSPLLGAVVTVVSADEDAVFSEPRSVLTGDDGRFEVGELVPGRYSVSATASGHLPAVQRSLDVKAGTTVTLALTPGGHPLRGTVSDATGGSLEGALIRLTPLAGIGSLRRLEGFGALSADDGTYSVHVAPGRYRVDVSHPDYATDTRAVEVGPGAQSQDFALVPMGVIEGVVREEAGAPVPYARVTWQRERQKTIVPGQRMAMVEGSGMVQADERGTFVVRGLLPGAIGLSARGTTVASTVPTMVPLAMAEHVTGVEVVVVAAHEVRGRVIARGDDADQGIAEATVDVRVDGPGGPSATTDAEGYFTITGVMPGRHMLGAQAEGWRLESDVAVTVEGDDLEAVVLVMDPAPTIRGRVEPPVVAEISIELRPETMGMGMGMHESIFLGGAKTESAEDGTFEVGPATPGSTTVVARVADGRAGEVAVDVTPTGADEVVIRLEERATVQGVVRSSKGQPVSQANVSLRRIEEPGASEVRLVINGREIGHDMGITTEDGRFEIGGVAEGQFEVKVTDRYGEPLPVKAGGETVSVPKGGEVEHSVTVDTHDGVIRGVVRTADGEAVADVWVQATLLPNMMDMIRPREGEGEEGEGATSMRQEMRMVVSDGGSSGSRGRPPVLTDENGRFEITGLRDADYELEVEGEGGSQRARTTARPGQEATLELAELGTIEGTVTIDGKAVGSYSLHLQGPSSSMTQVRDENGHFEVKRLDPGTYSLTVSSAEGRGSTEVTVTSGQSAKADITLENLLTITGRIVDGEGAPIVGAMVMLGEASSDGGISVRSDGDDEQNKTDEEGRFEVSCASGSRVLMAMSPTTRGPIVIHRFTVDPGKDADLGDLVEGNMLGVMGP